MSLSDPIDICGIGGELRGDSMDFAIPATQLVTSSAVVCSCACVCVDIGQP
jgi:hypothetical protein